MKWTISPVVEAHMERNGYTVDDMLGLLPAMVSELDPRGAVEQFDANYQHGGGWRDMQGWTLDADKPAIQYGDADPPILVAETKLRDERILMFNGAWVVVVQPDGSHRVSRMD